MKQNNELYDEVSRLINLIRIRLMARTQLMEEKANVVDPSTSDEDASDGYPQREETNEKLLVNIEKNEYQSVLMHHLPRDVYNESSKLLSETTNGNINLLSHYTKLKSLKKLISPFRFTNSEFLKLSKDNHPASIADFKRMSHDECAPWIEQDILRNKNNTEVDQDEVHR